MLQIFFFMYFYVKNVNYTCWLSNFAIRLLKNLQTLFHKWEKKRKKNQCYLTVCQLRGSISIASRQTCLQLAGLIYVSPYKHCTVSVQHSRFKTIQNTLVKKMQKQWFRKLLSSLDKAFITQKGQKWIVTVLISSY